MQNQPVNSINPLTLFNQLNAPQRSVVSAMMGFFFYGAWAYSVNQHHGMDAGIKAGMVQGSYSFALTFCMTMLLEGMYRLASRLFSSSIFACFSTISVCCAIVFSGSWTVNYLAGTPEILQAVIFGYIIGGIYSTMNVLNLARQRAAT